MATFVITARRPEHGPLMELQGQETHGYVADTLPGVSAELQVFAVPQVLEMIEGGDTFLLAFGPFDSRVIGGRIIPDGKGSLTEEPDEQGRRIADLDTF